ncbi:hypothetical protein TL16_g03339 [Triparma laevis f. inornata]|uniref:EF-hand domain-containing protein n=1 Tax=Triparma laevis f. inornata TaxID=1714386 RepID=A0A9W7A2F1_9STRA|nr:hypothetical protein TL16_g03339 [Triparma laevis f. inornata]
MAAAAIAARAAMMNQGDDVVERTDEELLAEALAEAANKDTYNKNTDPENYSGPIRKYVEFGNFCNEFIVGKYEAWFNGFILSCICVAGVLVGMSTYEQFEEDAIVNGIDEFILYVFTVECFVKIFAEGTNPVRFFTGPERSWNNFDFIVVILCYPFAKPLTGGNAAVLRLMRLARLMKILKKIPQLQMIVMGLLGGLSSIGYIVILLLLVFYLYAIVGVMYFAKNDPWHFGTLHIAMLSLFRASTLEDWTDIMYIGIYGCEEYKNVYCTAADPGECDGVPPMYWCVHHEGVAGYGGFGAMAAVYWITFIVISALVMLSLFVGAVTMSMSESMEDMKVEAEENERKERLLKKQLKMQELEAKGEGAQDNDHERVDTSVMSLREREVHKADVVMKALLLEAWEGVQLNTKVENNFAPGIKGLYQALADKCNTLANNVTFVNFITFVIILAGVMVGMQTFPEYEDDPVLNLMDAIILAIFTFEVIIKFIAEEFAPWRFFNSAWNSFDFVVVAGSFMPAAGSLVTMLRLLRLLRVLKLLKSLPQLAIIVNALIMGLSSIGFIGVILLLVFYLFAILGMILFKDNDPWHFGTLHQSILTLFRASTLEDWTDIMYINIYGCKNYGYMDDDGMKAICNYVEYPGHGLVAAIYFVIFTLLGALVLLTLFIGVICTSMEEATAARADEDELEERVKSFANGQGLSDHTIENYKKVFHMLDVDGGGTIEEDELRAGLKSIGRNPTTEQLQNYMREVDEDDSGEIDLAEFVEFMTNMKTKNEVYAADGRKRTLIGAKGNGGQEKEVNPDEHTPVQKFESGNSDADSSSGPGTPVNLAAKKYQVKDGEAEAEGKSPPKEGFT